MPRLLYLLFAFALFLPTTLHAQVIYVDADATGAANGTSWADAFTDLQDALGASSGGDQIWVAKGTYYPTDDGDRTVSFELQDDVEVYGGFDGTETSLDARDWMANVTTLSGDIGTPGEKTDNTYQVVLGDFTDRSSVLDGFVVTGAYADGAHPQNRGGGMRNEDGSPTVRNCVFRENEARNAGAFGAIGGGMFNTDDSSPLLENVRFERNLSQQNAGGLGNRLGSSPELRGVVFVENEVGGTGGGMTNESGSAPILVDVRFIRNTAGAWTGGLDNYLASPFLYNVVFYGNTCANYGCGMTNDTNADALLVNVLFVGNRKLDGGQAGAAGLQNNGSSPTLVNVTFAGNTAPDGSADGFGHRGSGTATLRNAVFWGNGDEIVDESGGVDLVDALVAGGYDDGVDVLDADPLFNRMPDAGADGVWGTPDDDYGNVHLQPGSPALDAGSAAHLPADLGDLDGDGNMMENVPIDLEGGARVLGPAPDLGVYEGAVTVSNEATGAVEGSALGAAYPNPASRAVSFPFTLSEPGHVRLAIYDALGRRVALLLDESYPAGEHALSWSPGTLASGSYIAVLQENGRRHARPFALVHP